jgi:glycosyltransferase involved in cell wall biosynthesis/tetratricopeptide (TPR) repeat protein
LNIDDKTYTLLDSEFNQCANEYSTLKVLDKIALYDRIVSLISNISNKMQCRSVVFGSITHGGYIPINCTVNTSFLFDCHINQQTNITANIENIKNNKQYVFLSDLSIINDVFVRNCVLFAEEYQPKYDEFVLIYTPIIITNKPYMDGYTSHSLLNTRLFVLVPIHLEPAFLSAFELYLNRDGLDYDNLINLCIMVKNGGDEFVSMLESNLPFIDRWTILDTGSTDNTVANIRRIMANKPGSLYQEPFINFGVSRNRCLELAGTQCTYNLMLDDTYHLKGDVRTFLQSIRGDQFADSFSIYITQTDIAYASNRIFKSKRNLKYKYAIHEVIQEENNVNVLIPKQSANIEDIQTEKLWVRTINRKHQDLIMLQEEIDTNPSDPRPYYYMAQTYSGMENVEKAYEWFLKRINHANTGFEQEKHEACLEAGRIAQFLLNRPSEEYLKLYERATEVDPERPDALYFLGSHYLTVNDTKRAFGYLLKGFKLGFPEHRQYCLKPSITYNHIPKLLTTCCYELNEYLIGEMASALYLKHNKPEDEQMHQTVVSWNKIFNLLVHSDTENAKVKQVDLIYPDTPICCFIAPCGLYNWTGSDILKTGMGGSESMVVEMATQLQRNGQFNVIVFCNCDQEETYKNVRYIPLSQLFGILHSHFIHTCIISRYSEYLPMTIKSGVENIFLMAHDVAFSINVITLDRKLKGVFCLSPWHAEHIGTQYPVLKPLIKIIGHGIDTSNIESSIEEKIPYKFIYTSLANRGLYELLLMWPKIVEWQPTATLHIYSNIDSPYMRNSFGDTMAQIRQLMQTTVGVVYYGCVDKRTLYESWKTASVWFYPTAFQETFCVSALEAAASKTLVIATNLAGLQHTVADRGVLIDSFDTAIETVIRTMENTDLKESLIARNYEWAISNTWEKQTLNLENMLLVNIFEYRDVFNWTDNVPSGSRMMFIDTIGQHIKPDARMLEIGVKTGISLIAMMFSVANSSGVAVDTWNPSMERSFNKNIQNSGMSERVLSLYSESHDVLLNLYSARESFDVIYMNNSTTSLDCYANITIAWKLLKIDGLLIVDKFRDIILEFIDCHNKDGTIICQNDIQIFIKKIQ